jgi:NAD(P)H-dependent flavin oxidoreductase YrpB (nitropropane dioxygenase family)
MKEARTLPPIIQGGMGIGVSGWRLARAVAQCGQLGVVSGTALDSVLVRRLQDGDEGGHLRRAMAQFPFPEVTAKVLRRYFRPEGLPRDTPYKLLPMYRHVASLAREQVTMLANFVEVYLAREGHDGPIGINLLTKIQLPTLASLYGAMLAGVDCALMGAGIPREIPAAANYRWQAAVRPRRAGSMVLEPSPVERCADQSCGVAVEPAGPSSALTASRPRSARITRSPLPPAASMGSPN